VARNTLGKYLDRKPKEGGSDEEETKENFKKNQ